MEENPSGAPGKRPMNAYMLFCNDTRGELLQREPDLSHKTVMQRLGELWKGLAEDRKMSYRERAKELQRKFKEEKPEYKYKPRKPRSNDSDDGPPCASMRLPPGITPYEASYFMLCGVQSLLSGRHKLTASVESLEAKAVQLKALMGEHGDVIEEGKCDEL